MFKRCFSIDGYMTLKEASEKGDIGERRIRTLCAAGRIEGTKKMESMWIAPVGAKKSNGQRIKTGKYIKKFSE